MHIISIPSTPVVDPDRLGRLYKLKRQQLDRAHAHHGNGLICRVLAAEADAIGDALLQARGYSIHGFTRQ